MCIQVLIFFIPQKFGFTYVQTVLMTCFVTKELLLPVEKKDYWYGLWGILVNVPVVVVGWIEALTCDSFLKEIGGHVFYDAVIPLSILLFSLMVLMSSSAAPKVLIKATAQQTKKVE
jgi:hypothetical protein